MCTVHTVEHIKIVLTCPNFLRICWIYILQLWHIIVRSGRSLLTKLFETYHWFFTQDTSALFLFGFIYIVYVCLCVCSYNKLISFFCLSPVMNILAVIIGCQSTSCLRSCLTSSCWGPSLLWFLPALPILWLVSRTLTPTITNEKRR